MQSVVSILKHETQLLSFYSLYICPNLTHQTMLMWKYDINLCIPHFSVWISPRLCECTLSLSQAYTHTHTHIFHLLVKLKEVSKPLGWHSSAPHYCSLFMYCLHVITLKTEWSWMVETKWTKNILQYFPITISIKKPGLSIFD